MGLIEMLCFVVDNDFECVIYIEVIDLLCCSKLFKKGKFEFELYWGVDFQVEYECFLVEKYFKKFVIVCDYLKDIKVFYMCMNDDDKIVVVMDVFFLYIGEVIGGLQWEECYGKLVECMK